MKSWSPIAGLVVALTVSGCTLFSKIDFPDDSCFANKTVGSRIYLAQCWDGEARRTFYTTSQGSQIAPYAIATYVELPDSADPFLTPANIEKWKYIPSGDKPYEWPIGFVRDSVPTGEWRGEWIGMNCAACHTGEIQYGGERLRIDGGPTLADKTGFLNELDASLKETYEDGLKKTRPDGSPRDGSKFERYAGHFPGVTREQLLKRLEATLAVRHAWHQRNDYKVNGQATTHGYGRLDAFALIFNAVNAIRGHEQNIYEPNAPVSYPFLWDTHFHDWVQWNGISPAAPTARNVAQLFGSFGRVQGVSLEDISKKIPYESSFRLPEQHLLEKQVQKLRAPMWPTSVFGEIDKTKAEKGRELFLEHCHSCHRSQAGDRNSWWRSDGNIKMVPVTDQKKDLPPVGTDSMMTRNALKPVVGDPKAETLAGQLKVATTNEIRGFGANFRLLREFLSSKLDVDKIITLDKHEILAFTQPMIKQNIEAYKSRPLDGIWATAPYLHNGSVPNLYELLLPPDKRSKTFYVGSRTFDPVNVGFITTQESGNETLLDTSIEGNHNTGHVYGIDKLTEEDRWALVEYQKTL